LPWIFAKAHETTDSFCLSFVTVWVADADISACHMLPERGSWGRLFFKLPVALLLPGVSISCYKYVIKSIIIYSRNSGGTALRYVHFGETNICCPNEQTEDSTNTLRSRRKRQREHARAGGESEG